MHLHFEIKNRKPSGRWGTEDSYAFLWQGYRNLHDPEGYATVEHTYSQPGIYFVHVFRKDEKGWLAEDRLYLRVEE